MSPRNRDVHSKPMPRIGGIAIFSAFLLVSIVMMVKGADRHIWGIWAGSTIIALSMIYDDLKGLSAWKKFIFQVLAALALIASGIGIATLTNPFGGSAFELNRIMIPIVTVGGVTYHFSLISDLITLIWVVGMMNIINFVDGVDGLAGGLTFVGAMTIFLLSMQLGSAQSDTAMLAIILSGATLGFLFWNFPPAKIFMGDSGAMFLGFMLGALTLVTGGKLATVFLALGFPIVDGLMVAGGRILTGKNPFTTPDKTHLHHRFLGAGFSPRQSIIAIYIISIAFAWVALRSTTANKILAAVALVLVLVLVTMFLRYKTRKKTTGSL